jgi:hypothetical protein
MKDFVTITLRRDAMQALLDLAGYGVRAKQHDIHYFPDVLNPTQDDKDYAVCALCALAVEAALGQMGCSHESRKASATS